MAHPDPDLPLVEALQAGDERAFDALLARHQEPVFRFLRRYLPGEADARDVAQETFVRAFLHIGKFRPSAKFSTWLYRIALNLCRDHVRKASYRRGLRTGPLSADDGTELQLPSPQPDPAAEAVRRERMEAVRRAVAALPEGLRAPFVLAALEGLPHAEAGARLGLTAKAVERKVRRAREALLRKLGDF